MSTMLLGSAAGTTTVYGLGDGWPLEPNWTPWVSAHLKPLKNSSTRDTPRFDAAIAETPRLSMAPLTGSVSVMLGAPVIGVPAPNTDRILRWEFWFAPHLHARLLVSPQFATSLRKNF